MMREECDVALVRIFECTLETTPQKVLQIGIILSDLEIHSKKFLILMSFIIKTKFYSNAAPCNTLIFLQHGLVHSVL